ncbi:amino acid ABC transporter ATP-binding protein [Falcatimonas sp. MSJ-15]|uniref:amino acid ABC transporter ATP-binding protein n=1 Tax=Falcatimonas sp. MSJ-15 TaxID=2841515 RepID=UPI0020A02C8D|nr:amino acid ABC transporter ATP-binding protein [Falcatimonas sp. MSJ-15]
MGEILEIDNLTKSFDGNVILNNISFKLKKGEVVVVLGPSGCGKSTFLRCINGLETIDSGEIRLDDARIDNNKAELPRIRQRIGMVFQSYDLFPHKNVLDNITLAPVKVQKRNKKEAEEEALLLLDRVGLRNKAKSYERQLSGGQKQRVAIVRSLIMHPEILLFDEVTAALDPEMVREVLEVILELAKEGKTMLIVTHEMEFARAVADRIIFMESGNIIEESTPKEFFSNPKTERAKAFINTFHYDAK